MSRSWVATWLIGLGIVIGTGLVLGGCESTSDPQVTGLASRDYEESFTVSSSADTVYFLLGTTEYQGSDRPASVEFDPEPSPSDLLQFRIRVVGPTLGTTPRAIMGYRWSADTLRVWCGLDPPARWGDDAKSNTGDPWTPSYLIPKQVNIGPPPDVVVMYIGQWFE